MGSDISDFQLRDEMKRKYEYQFLQVYLSEYDSSGFDADEAKIVKKIPLDAIVDIIIYCSQGRRNIAMNYLKTTQEFVRKCLSFLVPACPNNLKRQSYLTRCIVVQIWSLSFIIQKCIIEHNLEKAKEETANTDLLHEILVRMNEEELLESAQLVANTPRRHFALINSEIFFLKKKKQRYNATYCNMKASL